MSNRKSMHPGALFAITLAAQAAGPAFAQASPHIHVNGVHLDAQDIAALTALNCSTVPPDGDYWIDFQTGAWGYKDGPQQGWLGCANAATESGASAEAPASSGYREDGIADSLIEQGYSVPDGLIHMPSY